MEGIIEVPRAGLGGRFRYVLRDLMGRPVLDTGWDDNLYLNSAALAVGSSTNYWIAGTDKMQIGSNNQAPAVSDTGCITPLATASYVQQTISESPTGPNYEATATGYARFAAGVGTGTVREAVIRGFGLVAVARNLVTPEIVKGQDQILDVFYQFTYYPVLTDFSTVATIGGEPYNVLGRLSNMGGNDIYPTQSQGRLQATFTTVYNGDISADITGSPSGESNSADPTAVYEDAVDDGSGSGHRDVTLSWDVDEGNVTDGIRSVRIRRVTGEYYQLQFNATGGGSLPLDSRIPKTNTDEMTLTFRQSWGRRP